MGMDLRAKESLMLEDGSTNSIDMNVDALAALKRIVSSPFHLVRHRNMSCRTLRP